MPFFTVNNTLTVLLNTNRSTLEDAEAQNLFSSKLFNIL